MRALDRATPDLANLFFEALRESDGKRAQQVAFEALESGLSLAQVYRRVVQPAMEWVGEWWELGRLTVADEHLATAVCHRVMAALYARSFSAPPSSRTRVVVAGVEGEHHAVGVRMVADVLETVGYDVIELGASVPVNALVEAVVERQAAIVCLSVTLPTGVDALDATLAALRERAPDVEALIGGRGIPAHLRRPEAGYVADVETLLTHLERSGVADDARGLRRDPERGPVAREQRPTEDGGSFEGRLASATAELAGMTREQVRLAERYRALAYEDQVSGLPNRRAFDEELERLVVSERRGNDVLLMLDLDRFKSVNDSFGHEEGDRVLRRAGAAIRKLLRQRDFAARVGGDEFVVILPNTDLAEGRLVADRIRRQVGDDLAPWGVTASLGLSSLVAEARLAVLAADGALYAAKSAGRDCVRAP